MSYILMSEKETTGVILVLQQWGGRMVWSVGPNVPQSVNWVWRTRARAITSAGLREELEGMIINANLEWQLGLAHIGVCCLTLCRIMWPNRSWSCCEYPHTLWILRCLFSTKISTMNQISLVSQSLVPFFAVFFLCQIQDGATSCTSSQESRTPHLSIFPLF